MRDVMFKLLIAFGIVAQCLWIAESMIGIQESTGQLHNPYWPYSVELQVRDR